METTNNATHASSSPSTLPVYNRGDVVVINAPKHAAHGMRARIVKRVDRTVGTPGAVYTVRYLGKLPTSSKNSAPYLDTEELTLAAGCEECDFHGWLEMTEQDHDTRRVERCDTCNTFPTDEDALTAARADGWEPEACLSCWSPKCGLCGWCHDCDDDDLRRECVADDPDLCRSCGHAYGTNRNCEECRDGAQ